MEKAKYKVGDIIVTKENPLGEIVEVNYIAGGWAYEFRNRDHTVSELWIKQNAISIIERKPDPAPNGRKFDVKKFEQDYYDKEEGYQ